MISYLRGRDLERIRTLLTIRCVNTTIIVGKADLTLRMFGLQTQTLDSQPNISPTVHDQ